MFEECRTSKGTSKERDIWGPDRLGRSDGKTAVEHLMECLEDGMVESYIGNCLWGPENEHSGSKKGALNLTNLSDEDMTQVRWAAGETLSRSWERLHKLGVVTETTTVCLPNPLCGLLNRGPSVRVSGTAQVLALSGTRDSCELVHRIPQVPLPGKVDRGPKRAISPPMYSSSWGIQQSEEGCMETGT